MECFRAFLTIEKFEPASWSELNHCPVFELNIAPAKGAQLDQGLHVGGTGNVRAVRSRDERVDGVEVPVTGHRPGHRPSGVVTEDGALTDIDAPLERLLLIVAANLHRDLHRSVGQQDRLLRQYDRRSRYRLGESDANGCRDSDPPGLSR